MSKGQQATLDGDKLLVACPYCNHTHDFYDYGWEYTPEETRAMWDLYIAGTNVMCPKAQCQYLFQLGDLNVIAPDETGNR